MMDNQLCLKSLRTAACAAAICLALPTAAFAVTNSITITDRAGVTTSNYPIQIGRPFVQGEIANFPQAVVGTIPVPTQADVKQRWPDGSVKHAVLAFVVPRLNSNSTITVTFQDQGSGNNTMLTPAQMLAANFNFDAQMQLTNGGNTVSAHARAMLNAGAFSTWTAGNIAQTIILADHSPARTYDIGFDANRSFRPIFQATFWPVINKVRIRFIGEIANTEALQAMSYALALTTGDAPATSVYMKASVAQATSTRWTKEYWIGGAPPAVAINHNLAYLRETRFVPYYDAAIRFNGAGNLATLWARASKDLFDSGNWTTDMRTAGARPDIGPYPDWTVGWLYGGDAEPALGNADLAASWAVHYREGRAGKSMQGHVLSIKDRPTVSTMFSPNDAGTTQTDALTYVGSGGGTPGWAFDPAHVPEVASVPYVLTGDFWYLEESWFWSSMLAASNYKSVYHRGPTGSEGVLNHGQTRGMAWILRTRVNTAFISPDGSPEQAYFNTLVYEALAAEEGTRNITNTAFNGTPAWQWGRQYANQQTETSFYPFGVPTPLHQWVIGTSSFNQPEYGLNTAVNSTAMSLFESDYMLVALGRAVECGFPAQPLLSWLGSLYTGMLTDSGFNPYMIDNGRVPTLKSNGQPFSTFADLKTGYNSAWQARTMLATAQDPDGYAAYASAGISYLAAEPNGMAAWDFMSRNFLAVNASLSNVPKWAILPRGTANPIPIPPPPTSPPPAPPPPSPPPPATLPPSPPTGLRIVR
jgi:hypothetical protein